MPGIFYEPTDRRAFLRTAGMAAFAAALGGCQNPAKTGSAGPEFHLALLSDTHVPGDRKNGHRGFNPWENLKGIIPAVQSARPQGALICGDAARLEGLPDDYNELRALLKPVAESVPVYIGLGNHDDRANFRKAFPTVAGARAEVADKHVLVIDGDPARLILLDSLLYVNKVAGLLGKAQRAWLGKFLAANKEKPAILFVHHTLTDDDGDLLDAGRFFEIIEPHRHVKAVFFGHSHVWSISKRNKLHLVNLPAVGYNFRDQDPVGWVDARFYRNGMELTLHAFAGNRADDGKTTRLDWA